MAPVRDGILISWLAINHDPYETTRDGTRMQGPTLTFLFDEDSPYRGRIKEAVFFLRADPSATGTRSREETVFNLVHEQIRDLGPKIAVHRQTWTAEDPTDHHGLHTFLQEQLPALRRRYPTEPFYIHISPGTPAMQTMWVLMAETGAIEGPVTLVKTLKPWERRGRPSAVPVRLDLSTLFKSFERARPSFRTTEDQDVLWNPARFRSDRLKQLYLEAKRLAQLKVPILILGERGTGKTTLASWIRMNSPFRLPAQDAAWPSVACGQYSPETMRAELFGYKKGAFTDAKQDRDGLLKLADKDTLFLDEVGDVSKDVQRLLIRSLEERTFLPLGASTPESSDFRLLTATNRPLPDLEERLDLDFYDRINLFKLRLPSLRQIPEDLPWLWMAVYREAVRRSGLDASPPSVSDDQHQAIVDALVRHPLPGNLRDLFRVAYRLAATGIAVDDDVAAMNADDAIAYALAALGADQGAEESLPRSVARQFADDLPLDPLWERIPSLDASEVVTAFQGYLGRELLRLCRQEDDAGDAGHKRRTGVSRRTLYNWAKE